MNRLIVGLFTLCVSLCLFSQVKPQIHRTERNEFEAKMNTFVSQLMSKMTLEEKLGQLNLQVSGEIVTGQAKSSNIGEKIKTGLVGGIFSITGEERISELQKIAVDDSRLHIPLLFGLDVIHGYKTTFPIPLALASSWDMNLIEKTARMAAQEATADGICWTFSPMVDICRDARWGRVAEGSGEDPFLGSEIAKAMVRGYQGQDLSKNNTLLSCVKHFALYGAPEAGRDYNTVDMSRIRMYNEYLPPYKAAIDAGALSVMASFNEIDGIPATANHWLLTQLLRNAWQFNGMVVTDYTGIMELTQHGIGNMQQVSALALKAGVDMDMVSEGFIGTLKKSLTEKIVSLDNINQACKRVLEIKYRLGLFDDPYRYCDANRAKTEILTPENRDFARSVATQSVVLLENKNQQLPLQATGTIALIGPLADNAVNMPGTWSVATKHANAVSLLRGLTETVGDKVNILYAKGCNVEYDAQLEAKSAMFGKDSNRDNRSTNEILKEAVDVASKADVVILAIGEVSEMSGECSSRTRIEVPQSQRDLLTEIKKTGKPIIVVLFTGRPLELGQVKEQADAILNVWFPGSEAGYAISDLLFGKANPSGKLPITFPRNVGQVPLYYNHKNTGRPLDVQKTKNCEFQKFYTSYLDECNTPLYPFGYGLSYTSFKYGAIQLSATQLRGNQTLRASVEISNIGKYAGAEVVQLYIRDLVGSITRPVQELKGFQKIMLNAGEARTVTFNITPELLKFFNSDLKYDWEGGDFEIQIGSNSSDVQQSKVNWMK